MKVLRFVPGIAWFALSFFLLTMPGDELPSYPWFEKIHGDKLVHIGMFAVLVALFVVAIKKPVYNLLKPALLIGIFSLAYGIIMEFVQGKYIPMRSFDVTDMFADGIGTFLPFFALLLWVKSRKAA